MFLFELEVFSFQGMVEPGQAIGQALKAEFGEEAMAKMSVSEEEREKITKQLNQLFQHGVEVKHGASRIYLFTCLFVYLFVCLCVCLFIFICLHSNVHLLYLLLFFVVAVGVAVLVA